MFVCSFERLLSLLLVPSLVDDLFGERELDREEIEGEREEEELFEVLDDDLGDFVQCLFEQ